MESSHKIVSQNGQHSWLYRECLKNHAATLGAHATDGCGEFIASPASVLTCAACGCHRNFHRRVETPSSSNDEDEDEDEDEKISQVRRKKKKQQSHSYDEEAGSDVLLTLKTGGGGGPGPGPGPAGAGNGKKKRFRSKFSREQKDGMKELAEKLGWQLQRRHEDMVEDGCRAIGVERAVFKVWMHNNKQKQKQKELLQMNRRQQQQHHHHNNNNNNNNRMAMNSSSSSPSDRS